MILRILTALLIIFLCSCSTDEEKKDGDTKNLTAQQKADLQNEELRRKAAEAALHRKLNGDKYSTHNEAVIFATQPNLNPNQEKFNKVLKKAVDGDPDYQYSLAMCYKYGYVVKVDTNKALFWFKKAADQGHKQAERVYNFMIMRK